jgi:hypothetical protein
VVPVPHSPNPARAGGYRLSAYRAF